VTFRPTGVLLTDINISVNFVLLPIRASGIKFIPIGYVKYSVIAIKTDEPGLTAISWNMDVPIVAIMFVLKPLNLITCPAIRNYSKSVQEKHMDGKS
jgi:hypothetical protein